MVHEASPGLSHKADLNEKDDCNSSYGVEVTEVATEERRLVRRLDGRILPIACLMYLFACKCCNRSSRETILTVNSALDRSNLGNARLQDLPQSALSGDPTGVLFDWVTSAFYFSCVYRELPYSHSTNLYSSALYSFTVSRL